MQFNHTLSAIMRGKWLIDKQWADAHMPMVLSFMKGEAVNFGYAGDDDDEKDNSPEIFTNSGASAGRKKSVYTLKPYHGTQDISSLPDGSIALVNLSGPMVKRGGYCNYGMVDQAGLINRLGSAENISGIILNIDSPGGQADGTALLSDVIKNVSSSKPVIAMIDDGMAASAAMWIASAANEIYVTQLTDQVGSIGVYTQVADWNKYYKDFHKLDVQDIYAPQSIDKNKDYRDAINGDTTAVEDDLSVLADQFINTVATNRGTKIKGDKWKTGKMFYAKDAQKHGLIDGIKNFEQILTRMNTLTNTNSNSSSNKNSKMAFNKTLKSAKAESFEVVDGGFLLTEEHLNNLEAAHTTAELQAAELATANGNVQTLTATNKTLTDNAAATSTTISTQSARITELEAEVATLGKKPSGTGSSLKIEKDASTEKTKVAAYLADDAPENVFADRQMRRHNEKLKQKSTA